MAFLNGYQSGEASVCMTLASFIYLQENSNSYDIIRGAIESFMSGSEGNFATGDNWELIWLGISPDFANVMFMAANKNEPGQYAIAHRGTDWMFLDDLIEDLDVYKTETWPYVQPENPAIQVAKGAMDGLNILNTMTSDIFNTTAPGLSQPVALIDLIQYLASSLQSDLDIYITGHSLGAALATAYTSYLLDTASSWSGIPANKINVKTYTFASPTIGNQAYADYYNAQVDNAQVGFQGFRVHNQEDMVPYAFADLADLWQNGIPMTDLLKIEIKALASATNLLLAKAQVAYQQVGEPGSQSDHTLLNNNPQNSCKSKAESMDDYLCWVKYEHDHNTYLTLLGAPNVPLGVALKQE